MPSHEAAATFHALVGDLEYPMFIVTARAGDEPLGCLVGFATQTSIDPPRFAVCLSHRNRTFRHGHEAEVLGVHCVPEHGNALAELFGGETGDEVDKFARCAWRADAGDHDAFLLEPIAAHNGSGEGEFTFHRAKRIDPGHEA
jgi:flavin reductase (DIM6/NTAB) family NADH-FMN oxidoreductase RutF